MADLSVLRRKRTINKNCMNGLVTEIKDLQASDISQQTDFIDELTARIDTLKRKQAVVETLDNQIFDVIPVEESEADLAEAYKFEVLITKVIRSAENFLKVTTATDTDSSSTVSMQPPTTASGVSDVHSVPPYNSSTFVKSAVQLPKLNIAKFDGDSLKWKTFEDSFEATINKDSSLSNIQKMTYLQNLLVGTAADAIAGFPLSNDNYLAAFELLKKRFGDEQLLISTHMNTLLKIEPVKSVKNIVSLRKIYDIIEAQVRSLKALGIDSVQYGPMLVPILVSKVPSELNLIISRTMGKGKWDINEVLQALCSELEARERLHTSENSESFEKFEPSKPFSVDTFKTQAEVSADRKFKYNRFKGKHKSKCLFCNGLHFPNQCTVITDIEIRKTILQNQRRCFKCLKEGHMSSQCKSVIKCYTCQDSHHAALCIKGKEKEQPSIPQSTMHVSSKNVCLLQTAVANVCNTNGTKEAKLRILFDGGSSSSYISPAARNLLDLQTLKESKVSVKTFANEPKVQTFDEVKFVVKGNSTQKVTVSAMVSKICTPLTNQFIDFAKDNYSHLSNLKLADRNDTDPLRIDILIGGDFYWSFMTGEVVKPPQGQVGPVALHSILGFVLSGFLPTPNTSNSFNTTFTETCAFKVVSEPTQTLDQQLSDSVNRFWDIETTGVSDEDTDVLKHFTENISFNGTRYEVRLPFQDDFEFIDDNYDLCRGRLHSLAKKFKKEPELFKKYKSIIDSQIEQGIAEVVPTDNDTNSALIGNVHHLPHRAILKKDKATSKVRIVFDASATASGPSLNDCLLAGPTLTRSLFGILLRFRLYNIAYVADIKQAFLQISLHPDDRNFVRFLWFSDFDTDFEKFDDLQIITLRLCRVLFGVSSSPFLLQATLLVNSEKYRDIDPEFVDKLNESMHVDDLVTGNDTDDQAASFFAKAKERLSLSSFQLHKFQSNSKHLEDLVYGNDTENRSIIENIDADQNKVLGLFWNKFSDVFVFKVTEKYDEFLHASTKREVMHCLASIYDPLGLINPVVVLLKCFFQQLCVHGFSWDDTLPIELIVQWRHLVSSMSKDIVLNRCYCYYTLDNPIVFKSIHGFSDASLKAYGACVYFRQVKKNGEVSVTLISAKSRVAPLKTQSVPRLELMGALILAELLVTVKKELAIDTYVCWIDSMIVYFWLKNGKKHTRFVQNRINKIIKLLPDCTWRYVNTKFNPADIVSKGSTVANLIENKLWFNGPEFLLLNEAEWPSQIPSSNCLVEDTVHDIDNVVLVANDVFKESLFNIVDSTRYNSLYKFLRVTVLVCKFVAKLKNCCLKLSNNTVVADYTVSQPTTVNVTLVGAADSTVSRPVGKYTLRGRYKPLVVPSEPDGEETAQDKVQPEPAPDNKLRPWCAEEYVVPVGANQAEDNKLRPWCAKENDDSGALMTAADIDKQLKHYIIEVQREFDNPKCQQLKQQLKTFKDDEGIIRCKGRLQFMDINYVEKYPILLPSRHDFTRLVISSAHDIVNHSGIPATLAELRSKYYVPKSRSLVRSYVHSCHRCKHFSSKPYNYPESPPLPKERVTFDFPFKVTGLDYLGPVFVTDIFHKDNNMYKSWIVLFTCASTRAIHLELVTDNYSETFLRAFRRFISRRGVPTKIISDNASTFISGKVQYFTTNRGVTWQLNPPASPWWGGFFERLVQLVKRCLKKVLFKTRVSYEEMVTVLSEIESSLNNRPLTYTYSELTDEVLTPNHLIYGKRLNEQSVVETTNEDIPYSSRYRYMQTLVKHFTLRFHHEYLAELRERHARIRHMNRKDIIQVDDVVLIHDDKQPRSKWRSGVIQSIIKGKDNKVRTAVVRTIVNGKITFLRRPSKLLYPVETDRHDV